MWEGGECWIIGGGPSMPLEFGVPEHVIKGVLSGELPLSAYSPFLSPIHGKHVIGINAAFLLGDWIDVIFFGDGRFYFANKKLLDNYHKVKVSCNPNLVRKEGVLDVKYLPRSGKHPVGITPRNNSVSWNLNSGAAAISMAYHFGVKRIYLLGFDMQLGEGGVQHWHPHYKKESNPPKQRDPKSAPFDRHKIGFPMIANDARRFGLEIINVNPNSQITVFKRVKLSDVL